MIAERYREVQEKVMQACQRSHRNPEDVTLIAVSKTKPLEDLRQAYEAGARDFGENKVQELTEKIPNLPSDIRWHMIGHLQRNKVKYIVDKVYMIHSVDSLRLAEEISREAIKKNLTVKILMEVNVAQQVRGSCGGSAAAGRGNRKTSRHIAGGPYDGRTVCQ